MLKICNPGLDRLGATHFLTFRNPYLGRDTYFGGHWIKGSTSENRNAIAQTDTISTQAGSPKHHKLFEYAFQLNLNQSTIISRANTAVKHIKKKTLWLISPLSGCGRSVVTRPAIVMATVYNCQLCAVDVVGDGSFTVPSPRGALLAKLQAPPPY